MTESRVHSQLGASSAYRWFACPASVSRIKGLKSTTSKDAHIGSAAHALGEKALLNQINSVYDLVDETLPEFPDVKITEDMADNVQVYVDAVLNAQRELGDDTDLYVEQRFDLSWLHPELYGTNDACLVKMGEVLWVFDYKNGRGVVEHEENEQLMYYALGALHDHFGMFSEIRMTIVQPRAGHIDGVVRTYTTTPERLKEFAEELLHHARETSMDNPRVSVGEHCYFCPANGNMERCPESSKNKFELAKASFADFLQTKTVELPAPQDMSPEFLRAIWDSAEAFDKWITGVKAYVLDTAVTKGVTPDGYKLVRKNCHRKWIDKESVIEALEPILGDALYHPKEILSPAQAETKLKKINPSFPLGTLYVKPEGELTLAPESDKRSSEKPKTAENVFSQFLPPKQ